MNKYFDAHCHLLNLNTLPQNVGAIFNAAQISDWNDIIAATKSGANILGAIGIHPWYVSNLPKGWRDMLRDALRTNSKLLIGEIGLDKHRPDIAQQTSVFTTQLQLAYELQRGVQLHCVGAWDKVLGILRDQGNKLPPFIIAHEYSGPIKDMEKMTKKYNMYFSYGPRSLRNPERILLTPPNRILSETDGTNPETVIEIVDKISDILNLAPNKMADIIYQNTIQALQNDTIA